MFKKKLKKGHTMRASFGILVLLATTWVQAADVVNETPPLPEDSTTQDVQYEEMPVPEPYSSADNFAYAPPLSFYTFRNYNSEPAYPAELLPTPPDPNNIQVSDLLGTTSVEAFGVARMYGMSDSAAPSIDDATLQIGLQGRLGMYYDTGFAGGGAFSPKSIAIDGTQDARKRGQLSYVTSEFSGIPLKAELGGQSGASEIGRVQTYLELISDGDASNSADVRRVFARYVDSTLTNTLAAGKNDTFFGDLGCVPQFFTTGALPIGSVAVSKDNKFDGVPQLRYSHYWRQFLGGQGRLEWGAAVEDQAPLNDVDLASPTSTARLNRYPSVITRFRYSGSNGFDSYQVAALVRPMGFEGVDFDEDFISGWGISGAARFKVGPDNTNAIYLGVAGGHGVGDYIFNGTPAAFATTSRIETLANFGAFAAYQHFWYVASPTRNLSSNVLLGYVRGEPHSPTANRTLHQAGCNLIWNVSDNLGYLVEYQYGRRELGDGASGDDHRILIGLQFAMPKTSTKTTPGGSAYRAYQDVGEQPSDTPSSLRL